MSKAADNKPLSPRAKQRLCLLAGLIGWLDRLNSNNEHIFFPKLIEHLGKFPADKTANLKSCVDWLEDYENEEIAHANSLIREVRV